MPKELTHWMLAERAADSLPEGGRLKSIIAGHRNEYLGGAVLPDTLAHIFRGPFHPSARTLAHRFHDPAGNSYAPFIKAEEALSEGIPVPLLSCLLGVISHVEADVALHPYVYALAGNTDLGEHYRVETAIDVYFLQGGEAPAERRLERLLSGPAKEVLVSAARHLFDPEQELPLAGIEESVELHCRFQAMYDRTLWKLAVRLLGKVCGAPYSEQRHLFYPLGKSGRSSGAGLGDTWSHPETGEVRTSSLDDLAREAVERTVAVFKRIEGAGSLAAALAAPPGANLLTGLYGITKQA